MDKLISREELDKVISTLTQEYQVFAPTSRDGVKLFGVVKSIEEINWYEGNCLRSPKELFFPVSEAILSFRKTKKGIHIDTNGNHHKKRIIFGLRPCDARALSIIDNVFRWEYEDELYLSLRRNSTIISLSCLNPDQYCFCTAVDSSPFDETGSDILLTAIRDDLYHARIITEKGEGFLEKHKAHFYNTTGESLKIKEQKEKGLLKRMPPPLPLANIKSWLDANFEHPVWEEISLGCIGCGTCAYLCPTCHCFDLVDESKGYAGKRMRNWDSCAFDNFTQMAAHQPRTLQWQRFRQRVMHKFKYFMDRFSQFSCVGCGRCRALCPAGKDILQIIEKLKTQLKSVKKDSRTKQKG